MRFPPTQPGDASSASRARRLTSNLISVCAELHANAPPPLIHRKPHFLPEHSPLPAELIRQHRLLLGW